MSQCLGFGEHDGTCTNEAGSTHSPLWCQRCEDLRLAYLSGQFEKIRVGFDAASTSKEET